VPLLKDWKDEITFQNDEETSLLIKIEMNVQVRQALERWDDLILLVWYLERGLPLCD
jgi:hypothetical protein